MHLTDADYWRDAIGQIYADRLNHEAAFIAVQLAHTGEQFNAAIWAAIRLREISKGGRNGKRIRFNRPG